MNARTICIVGVCFALGAGTVSAQAQEPEQDYVSRQEHEALKRDFEVLKTELESIKQGESAQPAQEAGSSQESSWLELERTRLRLEALEEVTASLEYGESSFHVTGFAFTRFVDRERADSTFTTVLAPVFLWEINDRLLFESELELELKSEGGHGETEVELEYAHASYLLNDYITLGAGKFLTPFGLFPERLHPAWINKLPDGPLAFAHGGIAPFASVGAYVRGGFPVGSTKLNYAFYLSNGPALNTGEHEPDEAGMLAFENFSDINNNKAVGGRIGFLPVPELEIGYSFLIGAVNPTGDEIGDADALIQGVDVSYVREVDFLAGMVDLRFEYVRSEVDTVTFDPGGSLGFGPLTFDNDRDGLYLQLAYRPTQTDLKFLRDVEFVGRYDHLDFPSGAPESADTERWTFGINYWLNPSSVLKFAYQITDIEGEEDQDAFLVMFAIGF